MPTAIDTAYPRLKAHPTAKELDSCYTPTLFELTWAEKHARAATPFVGLVTLLKTFQRLGYFYKLVDVPTAIRNYIGKTCDDSSLHDWPKYDASSTRDRHMQLVRSYLGVTAYDSSARKIVTNASLTASRSRDDLADIINVAIEELVRQRYELPSFGTLLKIARAARARVNREFYSMIYERLGPENRKRLDGLLSRFEADSKSSWDALKQEPQRPTPQRTAEFLTHLEWLKTQAIDAHVFAGLPNIKLQQFAAEARSLDLSSVNDLATHKRYTIAASLVVRQTSRALDDITEMFIRQVRALHNKANEALKTYLLEQSERSDRLIGLLRRVLVAYRADGSNDARLESIGNVLPEDIDDRRQVSFVNQRHVTEQKLNEAIDIVIDGYRAFPLPEAWGLGRTASADGTQWDLYPQNLMSEYHIRYGDWGGLGYYLVADDYIALFSRFSTCSSWEGHYILDFVTETDESLHPEIVHADTQGQSAAIFGLAHLLGIQVMPRIRHWKDLHLYRASSEDRYEHIDALLTKEVDWELIAAFWPDMLRVAVSIAEGRVTPSTVLRRLATYSRKNKLYFAFRELGCAVRTIFLLQFLSDIDLRHKIQAATNKSEAFNKFAQWAFFAGGGVIAENLRDEQRKILKYNHLVTNLLMYHNVVNMSRALARLAMEGHEVSSDALAALSPYQTEHINRYGSYKLRLDRMPEPIDEVLRRPPQREKSRLVVLPRAQGHD